MIKFHILESKVLFNIETQSIFTYKITWISNFSICFRIVSMDRNHANQGIRKIMEKNNFLYCFGNWLSFLHLQLSNKLTDFLVVVVVFISIELEFVFYVVVGIKRRTKLSPKIKLYYSGFFCYFCYFVKRLFLSHYHSCQQLLDICCILFSIFPLQFEIVVYF